MHLIKSFAVTIVASLFLGVATAMPVGGTRQEEMRNAISAATRINQGGLLSAYPNAVEAANAYTDALMAPSDTFTSRILKEAIESDMRIQNFVVAQYKARYGGWSNLQNNFRVPGHGSDYEKAKAYMKTNPDYLLNRMYAVKAGFKQNNLAARMRVIERPDTSAEVVAERKADLKKFEEEIKIKGQQITKEEQTQWEMENIQPQKTEETKPQKIEEDEWEHIQNAISSENAIVTEEEHINHDEN